jgi:DNA-binding Lrp family transcriptional regulator
MDMNDQNRRLLAAMQNGLPLTPRPYRDLGARLGMSEVEVLRRLSALLEAGVIKRLGLIVRHRELGYAANAMAVWDVPDEDADAVGRRIAGIDFVSLCYRRPRRMPDWPYNLFCMIHGRDRRVVLGQVEAVARLAGLTDRPSAVLFSRRRFKQRGAFFGPSLAGAA